MAKAKKPSPRFQLRAVEGDRNSTDVLMDGERIGYLYQNRILTEDADPTRFFAAREWKARLKELDGKPSKYDAYVQVVKHFGGYHVNGDGETVSYDFTGRRVGWVVRLPEYRYLHLGPGGPWSEDHWVRATVFELKEHAERASEKLNREGTRVRNGRSGEPQPFSPREVITKADAEKTHYIDAGDGPDTLRYEPKLAFQLNQYVRFDNNERNLATLHYFIVQYHNPIFERIGYPQVKSLEEFKPHNRKQADEVVDHVLNGRGKVVGFEASGMHVTHNVAHECYLTNGQTHSGIGFEYNVVFFKRNKKVEDGHSVVLVTLPGHVLKAD